MPEEHMPVQENNTAKNDYAVSPLYKKLAEIDAIATAHASGSKKVLSAGRHDLTRITQIAFGILSREEQVPAHIHQDMDECFFVTRGIGTMTINDENFQLEEGVFVTVPARCRHSLYCTGATLEFFYFGLQVYNDSPG
jgi:mannose-6-phosphate isomerase-like protein (cupin superfamily)